MRYRPAVVVSIASPDHTRGTVTVAALHRKKGRVNAKTQQRIDERLKKLFFAQES